MLRRSVLLGCGTTLWTSYAGCSELRRDDPDDGVVLTHVEISNWTYEPQTFHLIVTYGDSIVHWATHEVEQRRSERNVGATTVEIERPEGPGAVEAYARVDDNWQALEVDTGAYSGDRITARFEYGRRGETIESSTVRTADLQATADT